MSDESTLLDGIRRVAFWSSFPLAAPQGLWVRHTAPRFADAVGARSGVVGRGRRIRVLGLGDSIIAGVGIPTVEQALLGQFASALADRAGGRVEWSAIGRTGARSGDVRRDLLPALPDEPFEIAVVSVGVNDITGLVRSGQFSRQVSGLIEGIRRHSPEALIVMLGLPPLWGFPLLPQPLRSVLGLRSRTFDRVMRGVVAGRPNCVHSPTTFEPSPDKFGADGYHPSAASCAVWGASLADRVMALERRPVRTDNP